MFLRSITLCIALLFITTGAEARHHHRHHYSSGNVQSGIQIPPFLTHAWGTERSAAYYVNSPSRNSSSQGIIGGRPSGCPHAFCGCSASIRVFGKIIANLNLARNWLGFPRTTASSGMVAVRAHHVFVLESPTSNPNVWVVHDGNSGGHKTRIHERSIQGYAIVNPRGGNRYASL